MTKAHTQKNTGFALIIGVLTAAVLLSIAFILFSITLKQIELSTATRESQAAVYAADTGLECALYWDITGDASAFDTTTSGTINCLGQTISTNSQVNGGDTCRGECLQSSVIGGASQSIFQLNFESKPYCAVVRINKIPKPTDPLVTITTIESRGYNTCTVTSPTRVERAFQVTY